MTLRTRLTLVAAVVVAAVVASASVITYFVMRGQLYREVDGSLGPVAARLQNDPQDVFRGFGPGTNDYVQLVGKTGAAVQGGAGLPVDAAVRAVALGKSDGFNRDVVVQGFRLREIVVPLLPPFSGAVIVAQNIDSLHHDLARLRFLLILVSLGGVAVAALAGALVSRATLAPVRRLTAATERIAKTGDPNERVPETGRGELARLARSFNTMLGALEASIETQRRFVADASHELRTPLTSLQTNIDVLRRESELDPDQRRRLLADLHRESQEMRSLIAGLLELARGDDPRLERRPLQFDALVGNAVERARARFPAIVWTAELEPTVVHGAADRLERAVWNLLENAGKWSGEGFAVEVTLAGSELLVRDHGPGIAPEDRPLVFDRFYRSAAARAMPGSGLGLSIVREVAEAHGGTVTADEAPEGGALMRFTLNGAARPNETLTDS